MSARKRGTEPILDDLLDAVDSGLLAISHGNDFSTEDTEAGWEIIVVRDGKKVYLSVKAWEPELITRLSKSFDMPNYKAEVRSKNGHHLIITKK